jgi:hypothetical protein
MVRTMVNGYQRIKGIGMDNTTVEKYVNLITEIWKLIVKGL